MTPDELARELGISPKVLRSWLRVHHPRSSTETHQRWTLDVATADAARLHFGQQQPSRIPERQVEAADVLAGLDAVVAEFRFAEMFQRADVLGSPCPVPKAPGVYGWWFRKLPTSLDVSRCLVRDGMPLLYTGISPKRPPANGKPPSGQTLYDRIRYHYTGNAEGSTLRKTLGSLLAQELRVELRRVGSGKRMTFVEGEEVLSNWMADNALVSWIVHPQPWVVEHHLISHVDLPLNLDGNAHNAFHTSLKAARARAVAQARELPVIPNPGVGGR